MIRNKNRRTRRSSRPNVLQEQPAATVAVTPEARGLKRIGVLRPLRHRDFALLWSGMTISLIGDGVYLVAIAFQVYRLSDSPSALSIVFFAWTAPMVLVFLLAGVLSDRFDRRLLMVLSDVIRGVSIGFLGYLSVTDALTLTHVLILVAIYGVGDALFMPAFTAIVPDIVPTSELVQANSLDNFVRPLTQRFLGPALGGALVAGFGPGPAFLVDAASFAVSAVAVGAIRARPQVTQSERATPLQDIAEGWRFVRARVWLWGTLLCAAVGLLCFIGPLEVLLPYVVKNDLGGGAGEYGTVLALGGIGAIVVSIVMGQRGLPRLHITFMYVVFTIGVVLVAAFAFVTQVWHAMAISLVMSATFSAGMIVWGTLMHRLVPGELLGRVSSLDWLVSTCLVPVSFILTGPIADRIGVDETLIGAGLLGGVVWIVFLFLPGMRDTERDGSLAEPEPEDAAGDGEAASGEAAREELAALQ